MPDELENRSESSSRGAPQLDPWKFKPGQSGNPGGRPKKKPITDLYEQILRDPKNRAMVRRAVMRALSSGQLSALAVVFMARDASKPEARQ